MKLRNSVTAIIAGLSCLGNVAGRSTRIRGTIDDLDFLVEADGHSRVHPRMLQAQKDFLPLTCNDNVASTCVPWKFGLNPIDVEIPCGDCYTMDSFVNNEVIEISGPLHIKGRLELNDGTKVVLKTTGVIVEGELAMTSTKPVDGTPDIVIELTGTDDVSFVPEAINSDVCGPDFEPCILGPKPIVVAGGVLDINGISDTCETWFVVEDVSASGKPNPLDYPRRPEVPTPSVGTCSDNLILESFDSGLNGWYGNLGAQESLEVTGGHDPSSPNHMKISKRTLAQAGPMIEIPRTLRECMLADTDYFFSAKVKIEPGPEYSGSFSTCHQTQTGCPKLRFSHMQDATNLVRWIDLIATDGNVQIEDGKWFDLKGVVSLSSDWIADSDVFSLLTINEVEPGIDISVDDVKLSLPPAAAFPDPNDVCGDLIKNGNADLFDGFTFPMYSFVWYKTLGMKQENGKSFFTMTNRDQVFDSLAVELNPGCLQNGATYSFSTRLRINSATEVKTRVALKITNSDGTVSYENVLQGECPATSSSIGWITCTGDFEFKTNHAMADKVELFFITGSNNSDDADFDDVSFVYKRSTAQAGMKLQDGTNVDSCYAPGAQLVVTSNDLNYDSAQIGTLSTVVPSVVEVTENLSHITTKVDAADYAIEVAFLSRNILFRPGDSDAIGPSLTILNTPGRAQKIKGAEFTGFGATGVVGRHPINLKSSSDSTGSSVSKNTVRSSKNRCINLDSTNNVLVSGNVAYDNSGHCYATHSGDETGNTFDKNIGIGTKVALVPPDSGETDNHPAVFYITNPQNSYSHNVAAGSEAHGFWFDLTSSKSTLDLTLFSDNTAHSSLIGFKTFPWGLQPSTSNTWLNTKAFKNRAEGIFFHNSENIIVQGGAIADNKVGIEINEADKITLRNLKIEGFTPDYKSLVDLASRPSHCQSLNDNTIVGVRLHANAMKPGSTGSAIENVDFSFFSASTGCSAASSALSFNPDVVTASYTTTVNLIGLTFDVGSAPYDHLTLCSVANAGVNDIYIEDSDGSMNPSSTGAGMIVSDTPDMAKFISCSPLSGTCAQFCSGVKVGDLDSVIAPAPTPATVATPAPVAAIPITDICLNNDDFELGSRNWFPVKATLGTDLGFGGTGTSVKASNRDHQARGGVWQRFSPTCLVLNEFYVVRADVKLTEANTDTIFQCDPSIRWLNPHTCASISFLIGTSLEEIAFTVGPYNSNGWNELYGVFKATPEMMSQSQISLMISRPPNTVDITVDNVAIGSARPNEVGVSTCSSPVANGDVETGDHRNWFIRGHGNNGEITIASGYPNGAGSALMHSGTRSEPRNTIMQYLDGSCFTAGSKWTISFYWKIEDNDGAPVGCDKSVVASATSCPIVGFVGGGSEASPLVPNTDTSVMQIGNWNKYEGSYTVDPKLTGFDDMWLFFYVPPVFNYALDDIVLTPAN